MKEKKSKTIAFTTKDGKKIQFNKTGSKTKTKDIPNIKHLKQTRSALEKAIHHYNHAVQNYQTKKQKGESNQQNNKKSVSKSNFFNKSKKATQVTQDDEDDE